jgi:ATP-dependent protease ClpP protease subunit
MVACCGPRSPSTELFELLGKHTGQALERIEREFERDRWFSPAAMIADVHLII